MAGAQAQANALLDYVKSNKYPDSEHVSSELSPPVCNDLREKLALSRTETRNEIRHISREVGSDVDSWIEQAQKLQHDIQRSREIAREIVEEAESVGSLKQNKLEQASKLNLLKKEVSFNETLRKTLEVNRTTANHISRGHDLISEGQLHQALNEHKSARQCLESLRSFHRTVPARLLQERAQRLHTSISGETKSRWYRLVEIDIEQNKVQVHERLQDSIPTSTVEATVELLQMMDMFDSIVAEFCINLEDAVLSRRLDETQTPQRVNVNGNEMSLVSSDQLPLDPGDILDDLKAIIEFINRTLPTSVSTEISTRVMPKAISQLLENWLSPSVPIAVNSLTEYDTLLRKVGDFSRFLAETEWIGATKLNEWIDKGPQTWLARHRESLLVLVRDVLTNQLDKTKVVERVETQMVSDNDVITPAAGNASDNWDEGWDDDAQSSQAEKAIYTPTTDNTEDEDSSAWDMETPGETSLKTNGQPLETADEAEAWGWDDAESPVTTKLSEKQEQAPVAPKSNRVNTFKEREVTLRETYTITAAPDAFLQAMEQLDRDAQTLRQPENSNHPIASAAPILYTLPTILLAGFRALASIFYINLSGGNMYLYNDSVRLASELTALNETLTSRDPASAKRARLDAEITALTHFSARVYGKEMEAQRTILRDLLDDTQGFTSCTEAAFARECESAIAMVTDRLRAVAAEWKPILSQSVWFQSLGSLINTVLEKVIADICDLSDISETESVQLKKFLDEISTVSDLFMQAEEPPVKAGEAQSEEKINQAGKRDMTGVYAASWFRFQYLAEILESSLADIKYLWQEGELRLEFEVTEVIDLIEALFADSDHRRKAIAEIKRS